jgi:hypothetical protein
MPDFLDSAYIRISYFHFLPLMDQKRREVRMEPEMRVVLSQAGRRVLGPSTDFLPAIRKSFPRVPPYVGAQDIEGWDDGVRQFLQILIQRGLLELPDADLSVVTPEWLRSMQKDIKQGYFAQVFIVETDRGKKAIIPHQFMQRPELQSKFQELRKVILAFMSTNTVQAYAGTTPLEK